MEKILQHSKTEFGTTYSQVKKFESLGGKYTMSASQLMKRLSADLMEEYIRELEAGEEIKIIQ